MLKRFFLFLFFVALFLTSCVSTFLPREGGWVEPGETVHFTVSPGSGMTRSILLHNESSQQVFLEPALIELVLNSFYFFKNDPHLDFEIRVEGWGQTDISASKAFLAALYLANWGSDGQEMAIATFHTYLLGCYSFEEYSQDPQASLFLSAENWSSLPQALWGKEAPCRLPVRVSDG